MLDIKAGDKVSMYNLLIGLSLYPSDISELKQSPIVQNTHNVIVPEFKPEKHVDTIIVAVIVDYDSMICVDAIIEDKDYTDEDQVTILAVNPEFQWSVGGTKLNTVNESSVYINNKSIPKVSMLVDFIMFIENQEFIETSMINHTKGLFFDRMTDVIGI